MTFKGAKEIVLSFLAGLLILGLFLKIPRTTSRQAERSQSQDEPVTSVAEDASARRSLFWGLNEIHAPAAWTRNAGSGDVVVAVIDTGCDVHHTDLSANIWRNPGESGLDPDGNPRSANGVDDDDNGFVDDVYGWNFAADNSDVQDEHGHGTHIAGLIAAKNLGAPQASLMILKYYDTKATGQENLAHTIEAIRYAVRMGAKIINYSGGGLFRSPEEEEALRFAAAQGVLVVAAAGNEGVNSDFEPFYPADYELPNILSIAAIDRDEKLLPSSNFGIHSVDLAAPGKNIYSTLPNGEYGYMTGTSQATAFVSAVAAELIASNPRFADPRLLIDHLLRHSRKHLALKGKLRSGSLLDAGLALPGSDLELAQANSSREISHVHEN